MSDKPVFVDIVRIDKSGRLRIPAKWRKKIGLRKATDAEIRLLVDAERWLITLQKLREAKVKEDAAT